MARLGRTSTAVWTWLDGRGVGDGVNEGPTYRGLWAGWGPRVHAHLDPGHSAPLSVGHSLCDCPVDLLVTLRTAPLVWEGWCDLT